MLAYASPSPLSGSKLSPRTLALILAAHAGLIAVALTARAEMAQPEEDGVTVIRSIPLTPPPPPADPVAPTAKPRDMVVSHVTTVQPVIDRPSDPPVMDSGPAVPTNDLTIGHLVASDPVPAGPDIVVPPSPVEVVRTAPRLATAEADLRPPYPDAKRRDGEEATLRLRLTIDARGRVIAVDPLATADPVFLKAARDHILRRWRYRPATRDGVAVGGTIDVSLSFKLAEDA